MTRSTQAVKIGEHLKAFKNENNNSKPNALISKKVLWDAFNYQLPKTYIIDERNKPYIYTLLRYFRGQDDFNEYNLILNQPSLTKGILLFGDNGVGKTQLFNTLQQTGEFLYKLYGWKAMRFDAISCGSFTEEYMRSVKSEDSNFNLKRYQNIQLYIDDLGFEKKAFLNFELLSEVLFERHRNQARTFVTTNKTPSEITERYGTVIGDRLPEMFNIIKWEGDSFRWD